MDELLILVDDSDNTVGFMEKMEVHRLGILHRAFSVFIFNQTGELLLQQRAATKYHSPNLWSNSCCSHPRKGEKLPEAVNRRLVEELGIKCKTEFRFSFIYNERLENGMTEYEYDHVFTGITNDVPVLNKKEVSSWKYISIPDLEQDIKSAPLKYTVWLKYCLPYLLLNKIN